MPDDRDLGHSPACRDNSMAADASAAMPSSIAAGPWPIAIDSRTELRAAANRAYAGTTSDSARPLPVTATSCTATPRAISSACSLTPSGVKPVVKRPSTVSFCPSDPVPPSSIGEQFASVRDNSRLWRSDSNPLAPTSFYPVIPQSYRWVVNPGRVSGRLFRPPPIPGREQRL